MTETQSARAGNSRGCLALAGGIVLGLLLAGFVLLSINRQKFPPLDRPQFDAARELWKKNGPASYDIEIHVYGRQTATYTAEVRNGEVQLATVNGVPLRQRRIFETWSVPGMFATIRRDVENLEKVKSGRADAMTPRVTLRGKFDETYGYPLRYLRLENSGVGDNPEVTWEVTRFSVVRDEKRQ